MIQTLHSLSIPETPPSSPAKLSNRGRDRVPRPSNVAENPLLIEVAIIGAGFARIGRSDTYSRHYVGSEKSLVD